MRHPFSTPAHLLPLLPRLRPGVGCFAVEADKSPAAAARHCSLAWRRAQHWEAAWQLQRSMAPWHRSEAAVPRPLLTLCPPLGCGQLL